MNGITIKKFSKNFKYVFLTDNLSFIMNKILLFCMPLWIMETTKSSIILSIFNSIILLVSVLVSPFAGALSDRNNKVLLMKVGNVLKFISATIIFVLFSQPQKMSILLLHFLFLDMFALL